MIKPGQVRTPKCRLKSNKISKTRDVRGVSSRAALSSQDGTVTLRARDSTFSRNSASVFGGGVYAINFGNGTFSDLQFASNSATGAGHLSTPIRKCITLVLPICRFMPFYIVSDSHLYHA